MYLFWHLFTDPGKASMAEHSKTDAVAYLVTVAIAMLASMLML